MALKEGPERTRKPSRGGGRLSAPVTLAERAMRANKIIELRWRGDVTWEEISKEVGLTARQCKEIFRRETQYGDPRFLEMDQVAILESVIRSHQQDIKLFSALAEDAAADGNLMACVAALKAKAQRLDQIVTLLQQTNRLPHDLGQVRHLIDFRGMARSMLEQVDALRRGEKTAEEVAEFFYKMAQLGTPDQARTGIEAGEVIEGAETAA